ncbi:MAG: TonB-dependent receptor plug domain-containing protein, partial [Sphingobacteriales bacterium]
MTPKQLLSSIALVCLLLWTQVVYAQNKTISGKVTDSKDGAAISGATIQPKGTRKGVTTGADGSFKISVDANVTKLVISSVGYASEEVDITGKTEIAVSLVVTNTSLNEVVVVGYGTAKKKDLTGAVSSVQAKDFNKGIFAAPDQLIQGKVSGVQIISNSGQPGGPSTVKIRGNSAVTGSGQPLYVVDGVPLDGRSARPGIGDIGLGGSNPGSNPLNFLNPSDIASIDVLKDASATAIYGSRAAYGVVIITTKRGQSGQAKLDFSTSVGYSQIMKKIKVLNASEFRQALTYYGLTNANDKGSSVDALDAILRNGLLQNYNLAISGGNESSKYRISLGALNQEGIVRKSGIKKYTANIALNFKFLERKN